MKSCFLLLDLNRAPADRIAREGPVRALTLLKPVFTPCWIAFYFDGVDQPILKRESGVLHHNYAVWSGEELGPGPLTRFTPGETDLITSLQEVLDRARPRTIRLCAEGAFFHRAAGTAEPAWYGHRLLPNGLDELCRVDLNWDEWTTQFQLIFPMGGYPLTSCRLVPEFEDGDPAIAEENRARLFETLRPMAAALEVSPRGWNEEGDCHRWYPEDAKAIRSRWIPYLCGEDPAAR